MASRCSQGEAEARFENVLLDACHHTLKPLYNNVADPPSLENMPMPILPATRVKRKGGKITTFDAGRGCPFLCSFCTIIKVQGRKSRRRSVDDVEQIIRHNLATASFLRTTILRATRIGRSSSTG